jgi:molybdopterin-guanine dinucleotide biosynthesis protein A
MCFQTVCRETRKWYHFSMHWAGFVLAGGRSARMYRDKALLPRGPGTLLESVARQLQQAVNKVAVIGDPLQYARFGYPVYSDFIPGCGPISGLHTALCVQAAEWNLIVACDMPRVASPLFKALRERAEMVAEPTAACVVPLSEAGELEPLCAAYHASCLPSVARALQEQRFKMKDLLTELQCVHLDGWPPPMFANINTPEEWREWKRDPSL